MSVPQIIQQGDSLPFSFDRGTLSIAGWTCLIQVRRFPDEELDDPNTIVLTDPNTILLVDANTIQLKSLISRIIAPTDCVWMGTLTSSETIGLDIGLWYLIAKISNATTGEEDQVPLKFEVTPIWN